MIKVITNELDIDIKEGVVTIEELPSRHLGINIDYIVSISPYSKGVNIRLSSGNVISTLINESDMYDLISKARAKRFER